MIQNSAFRGLFSLSALFLSLSACREIETVKPAQIPIVYQAAVTVPDEIGATFTPSSKRGQTGFAQFPEFKLTSRDVFIYASSFDTKDAFAILNRGYSHISDLSITGDIEAGINLQNRAIPYNRRARFMSDNILGDGKWAPNFYAGLVPPESEMKHIIDRVTENGAGNKRYADGRWAEWTIIDFEFPWPKPSTNSAEFNRTWSKMAEGLRKAYPYTKVSAGGLIHSATEEAWEPMDARVVLGYLKHLIFSGDRQESCKTAPERFEESRDLYYQRWVPSILVKNEWFRKTYPTRKNLSWQSMTFEDCIDGPSGIYTDDLAEGLPIWHVMTGGTGLMLWGDGVTARPNDFFMNGLYRLSKFNAIRERPYEFVVPRISFDGKQFGEQRTIDFAATKGEPMGIAPTNWKMLPKEGRTDPREPILRAIATEDAILIVGFDPTLDTGQERIVYVNHRDWVGKVTLKGRHTFLGGLTNQKFGRPEN